ncbi:uncharacterized protein [Solanum tuberosum]|uniref:Ulp1 protease family, C-terminal catalytic domain containing protein n=1 Tax=Solanum tuberosum TaxID=4113 RepID=M1C486_SOLTU|nr:PREDICTED: uncharacterized protein LOC107060981 [Solanum tuberosum]
MLQYKRKRTGTSSSNPNAKENAESLTAARKRGTTTLQSIGGQPSGEEKSDEKNSKNNSDLSGEEKSDENSNESAEKKIETHWLKMASKKSVFNSYPWGRVSFDLTISYFLKELYSTKSQYNLHGCSWAFAAWAFEAIPALQRLAKDSSPEKSIPRMIKWMAGTPAYKTNIDPIYQTK